MEPSPDPQPAYAFGSLTRNDVHQLVYQFGVSLPPAIGNTADDRARRDNAALARVAAMQPANAEELDLAARCVSAGAQADDQSRQLLLHAANFDRTRQINAQYALMVRTSSGARSLLLRLQTARRRLEMDAAACAVGAALAAGLLALLTGTRAVLGEELETATAVVAEEAADEAAKVAAAEAKAAEAKAGGAPWGGQYSAWPAPAPQPPPLSLEEREREKWLTAADSFSTIYPLRTRLIRRFGRLPDDCGIEQPEPKLLEAIRTGNEYSQRWADGMTKAQVYINAGNDRYLCKYEDDADALLLDPGRLAGVVAEAGMPGASGLERAVPEGDVPEGDVPDAGGVEGDVPERDVPEGDVPDAGGVEGDVPEGNGPAAGG